MISFIRYDYFNFHYKVKYLNVNIHQFPFDSQSFLFLSLLFIIKSVSTSRFLTYKSSKLHYIKSGSGSKTLLLFHGFGQDHRAFDDWTETLTSDYTLYTFDLFFHGQSDWSKQEGALEKEMWREIIELFLTANKIEKFSTLGFSMGGKFALALLELFPNQLVEIFLLAPDGIKTNFWYSLATYPLAFRKFFKSMIAHHGRFLAVARVAHKLKLIDRGVLRFVEFQMNTEEKRKRVYYSWVVFRHLKFELDEIASLLNEKKIPTTLIIGRYDKIITAKNMEPFVKKLHTIRFEVIDAGHNDLIAKSIKKLFVNS
jgi:pimeloyl-ACP methyl ester carboxylesterase